MPKGGQKNHQNSKTVWALHVALLFFAYLGHNFLCLRSCFCSFIMRIKLLTKYCPYKKITKIIPWNSVMCFRCEINVFINPLIYCMIPSIHQMMSIICIIGTITSRKHYYLWKTRDLCTSLDQTLSVGERNIGPLNKLNRHITYSLVAQTEVSTLNFYITQLLCVVHQVNFQKRLWSSMEILKRP